MTLEPTAAGRGAGDLRLLLGSLAIVVLLAGCASYDGRSLVPGQSRAADVEALMGAPAEKLTVEGGSVWFYPRQPQGRQTFAVSVDSGGLVRAVEQRLTVQNVHRLRAGSTTRREVRELLGPPWRIASAGRRQGEAWDYAMFDDTQKEHNLSVLFSDDGVVSRVYLLREMVNEPTGM
jgi:outer membrane protein assembly factor BamE (lipoprotein component of BamABCDE complex)